MRLLCKLQVCMAFALVTPKKPLARPHQLDRSEPVFEPHIGIRKLHYIVPTCPHCNRQDEDSYQYIIYEYGDYITGGPK